jgi:hypothetical protein
MSARLTKQFLAKFKEGNDTDKPNKNIKRGNDGSQPPASKKQKKGYSMLKKQKKRSSGKPKDKKSFLEIAERDKEYDDQTQRNVDLMLYRPKALDRKQEQMLAILKKTQGFARKSAPEGDDSDDDSTDGMFEF